jgi:ParB family chromosome partitioning protein
MTRRGLGRGLEALIPSGIMNDIEAGTAEVRDVALERIRPNPNQPRRIIDDGRLGELADSIRRNGLLQPLLVRRSGDDFELIAGERRYRAALAAGLERAPVVVHQVNDGDALKISLVENIQRDDLNPIEEAHGYARLMEALGLSQKGTGDLLGKDRATIANSLRLLRLSPVLQEMVISGTLSPGHARALLGIEDEAAREELARRVAREGLTVRDVEDLASEGRPERPRRARRSHALDHHLLAFQEKAERHLGTRVRVRPSGDGGTLTIRFQDARDLERIATTMGMRFDDF